MGVEDFAIENGVLTKYKGAGGDVVIPEGVTEIGEDAFLGCSSLESVSIPEGVREIGEDAFAFCKSLKSVTIPEGVKKIGRDAFRGCGSLKTISTPGSVAEIGASAFRDCSSLESVSIPEGVKKIGREAFRFCGSLKTISIPASVAEIGEAAFTGCSGLKLFSVAAGNARYSVTSDGRYLLEGGTLLSYFPHVDGGGGSCEIPASVTAIGASAFYDCSSLKSVAIPEGVTEIGASAFESCRSLESVTIPEGATEIGRYAFSGCSSLARVVVLGEALPEGFAIGPDTALVSPRLSTNAAKGKRISKALIAAGRVIYALENPGHELDDATRKYIRAQLPGVCEALRYDTAAILWIADNGLVSGAAAAKAATACAEKGLTEAAAALLDASAASKKKSKLEL